MPRIVVRRDLPEPAQRDSGADVSVSPHDRVPSAAELREAVRGADAAVAMLHDRIDDDLLAAAGGQLRVVTIAALPHEGSTSTAARRLPPPSSPVVFVVSAFLASSAGAGQISFDGHAVTYAPGPDESDSVVVGASPYDTSCSPVATPCLTLFDSFARSTPGTGCTLTNSGLGGETAVPRAAGGSRRPRRWRLWSDSDGPSEIDRGTGQRNPDPRRGRRRRHPRRRRERRAERRRRRRPARRRRGRRLSGGHPRWGRPRDPTPPAPTGTAAAAGATA